MRIIISLMILLGKLFSYIYGKYKSRRIARADTPLLMGGAVSEDMFGISSLTPKGNRVAFIASTGISDDKPGVYSVDLPFVSGVHLIGFPVDNQPKIHELDTVFEQIHLEGDYPNYFNLYAEHNQDYMTQYVLDPAAMRFTVEFCKMYQWEIQADNLYFSSRGTLPSFDIIDTFIDEIRPSVEVESARRRSPYSLPYGQVEGFDMKCPRCSDTLLYKSVSMECPRGDGFLITGSNMLSLQKKPAPYRPIAKGVAPSDPNEVLKCPYCSYDMRPSVFATTNVVINVCSGCMYRWIDSSEASTVFGDAVGSI